jgi:tetratricopeptide (TPR) repeat protein
LSLDSNDIRALTNRGTALAFGKGQPDRALADFDRAIQIDPTSASTYYNRALVWFGKKDFDRALADVDQLIKLTPRDAEAHELRGQIHHERGHFEQAQADYTEAIRLDPRRGMSYYRRGLTLLLRNETEKAITDLETATRLDPQSAAAWNELAWVLATHPDDALRDGRRAIEAATRACELTNRTEPNYLDTLATAQAETGDFAAAVRIQREALAALPDLPDEPRRPSYQARLELYLDGKPFHEETAHP